MSDGDYMPLNYNIQKLEQENMKQFIAFKASFFVECLQGEFLSAPWG